MSRAVYGIASSIFHAIRVLSDIADTTEDEQTKLAIRESFYVDDYTGGADTEEQAIRMRQSLTDSLDKACLHTR